MGDVDRSVSYFEFSLRSTWPDNGVRPARPQLARAQELVKDLTDPKVAWHKLGQAGLLPRSSPVVPVRLFRRITPHSLGADSRAVSRFIENMDGGLPAQQRYFVTDRTEPFAVEDAVLVAADSAGFERAEAAAFTARERLKLWGVPLARRTAWQVMSPIEPTFRTQGGSALSNLRIFLTETFDQASHKLSPYPGAVAEPPDHVLWNLAAEHGYRVPHQVEDPYFTFGPSGPPPVPQTAAGTMYRELPNPFEPLQMLAALGYRVDAFTEEETVLLVPPR